MYTVERESQYHDSFKSSSPPLPSLDLASNLSNLSFPLLSWPEERTDFSPLFLTSWLNSFPLSSYRLSAMYLFSLLSSSAPHDPLSLSEKRIRHTNTHTRITHMFSRGKK